MHIKNLNLKPVIIKIFFTYLFIYLLVLIFRYNYDIELLLINVQYKYLIALNIISIFSGLPLTIIFDFILIKIFGFYYVLFFTPVLTVLGVIQILILRKCVKKINICTTSWEIVFLLLFVGSCSFL